MATRCELSTVNLRDKRGLHQPEDKVQIRAVIEIVIGVIILGVALSPKAKFYPRRLGTKQKLPPIEPSWIPRLFMIGAGLIAIIDGVRSVRH